MPIWHVTLVTDRFCPETFAGMPGFEADLVSFAAFAGADGIDRVRRTFVGSPMIACHWLEISSRWRFRVIFASRERRGGRGTRWKGEGTRGCIGGCEG